LRHHRPPSAGPARLVRTSWAWLMILGACSVRAPVIVPPAGTVAAVEGFGSVWLQGAESALKGKFAFHFRVPGLGRIEALDPLGRAAFYLFLAEDKALFVLPREKAYCEEAPETLMDRLLGFALLPDDMIRLLGGQWDRLGSDSCWVLERDGQGRVVRGDRDDLRFSIREFFRGGGVPRDIAFSRPGMAGRLKVLDLRFDPPLSAGAFDASYFRRKYSRKGWTEIEEMLRK
jgi:hypothetical protein